MTRARARIAGLAALTLAACSAAPAVAPTGGLDLMAATPGRVRVLVFTSHECPIANAYAPTLRDLAARFRADAVDWIVVHVDPDLTAAAAAEHARAYELPGAIVREPRQQTAQQLGITRTPEAAVLAGGELVYRGRIDDQWAALGVRRAAAAHNDLADAIAAALVGRPAPTPRTTAVGCLLPEPAR